MLGNVGSTTIVFVKLIRFAAVEAYWLIVAECPKGAAKCWVGRTFA